MSKVRDDYKVGENVWAKLKGYPWWPARVEDERQLPKKVASKKPKNSNTVWPVFFYGSRDYGWFGKDSIRPFEEYMNEYKNPARKTALFIESLNQALDPSILARIEAEEEEENLKKKTSNKKEYEEGAEEEESEEEEPKEKKAKPPAKRKPPTRPARSQSAAKKATTKQNGQSTSRKVSTSQVGEEAVAMIHELTKKDPTKAEMLKNLRHALQKQALKNEYSNHESIDSILTKLEETHVTYEEVQEVKLAKLIRHILAHPIPENDYNFEERYLRLEARFKALKPSEEEKPLDLFDQHEKEEAEEAEKKKMNGNGSNAPSNGEISKPIPLETEGPTSKEEVKDKQDSSDLPIETKPVQNSIEQPQHDGIKSDEQPHPADFFSDEPKPSDAKDDEPETDSKPENENVEHIRSDIVA